MKKINIQLFGLPNWPVYGEDVGSAVEDVEKFVAKIKTNKYSKKDLIALFNANNIILGKLLKDED